MSSGCVAKSHESQGLGPPQGRRAQGWGGHWAAPGDSPTPPILVRFQWLPGWRCPNPVKPRPPALESLGATYVRRRAGCWPHGLPPAAVQGPEPLQSWRPAWQAHKSAHSLCLALADDPARPRHSMRAAGRHGRTADVQREACSTQRTQHAQRQRTQHAARTPAARARAAVSMLVALARAFAQRSLRGAPACGLDRAHAALHS